MKNSFSKNLIRIFQIVAICFLIFLAIICCYLAGSMLAIASEAPDLDSKELMDGLSENSKIVDSQGNLMEQIETAEYRKIVKYEDIPKNMINALVSAEDKRFWKHKGVDGLGVITALKDLFTHGNLRGASTITMQLARNVYLNRDVNWTRKIQEMYLALRMEEDLSNVLGKEEAKKKIIEAYLNRVFFGQQAYGIEAASQIYFSKACGELNLAQCATLASVLPAPSKYSLYRTYRPSQVTDEKVLGETTINGERFLCIYNSPAYARSEYVLEQMVKNGYINSDDYKKARAYKVADSIKPPAKQSDNASSYVVDLIKNQAIHILMDAEDLTEKEARNRLFYGGLTISSTIDNDLQTKLQDSFSRIGKVFNETEGGGANSFSLNIRRDRFGNIVNKNGKIVYYKASNVLNSNNQLFIKKNEYKENEDGSITILPRRISGRSSGLVTPNYYTYDDQGLLRTHRVGNIPIGEEYITKHDDGSITISSKYFKDSEFPLFTKDNAGNLIISQEHYTLDEKGVKQPQFAATVIDTKTGEIRASIGGRDEDESKGINRASSQPRQPGSSIKPISEYTAALALGYNQGSAIDDTPIEMHDNKPWPQNVDGRYHGLVTMRDALYYSYNPPAAKWMDKVGISTVKEYLTRYGVINKNHPDRDHFISKDENAATNDENLSTALGALTYGLSTMDMAEAYQAIGNNGQHIKSSAISKIVDNRGKVYYENKHESNEVLNPRVNYQLLDMLMNIAQKPTNKAVAPSSRIDLGLKTGTTDGPRDFWTCAVTPYYSTAVWMGSDNAQITLNGYSGIAVSLYGRIAKILNQGKDNASFERPEGLYEVEVCTASGMKPGKYCHGDHVHPVKKILVSKETEPKEVCDIHVSRLVDTRNNLLASETTPEIFKGYRTFTQRKPPYNPSKFNGITPTDWQLEVPSKYSNLGLWLEPIYETLPNGSTRLTKPSWDGSKIVTTDDGKGTRTTVRYDKNGVEVERQVERYNPEESSETR